MRGSCSSSSTMSFFKRMKPMFVEGHKIGSTSTHHPCMYLKELKSSNSQTITTFTGALLHYTSVEFTI